MTTPPDPTLRQPTPPRAPYIPPCLERQGRWVHFTGTSCEPGVVCPFGLNPFERLDRLGGSQ